MHCSVQLSQSDYASQKNKPCTTAQKLQAIAADRPLQALGIDLEKCCETLHFQYVSLNTVLIVGDKDSATKKDFRKRFGSDDS